MAIQLLQLGPEDLKDLSAMNAWMKSVTTELSRLAGLSGAIDMGGERVTNVAEAADDTDVLTRAAGDKRYVKL